MIRGAVKDTKDAIIGYVNGGVITPNEGRAMLDMNPDRIRRATSCGSR
jgi:hypothetical protein